YPPSISYTTITLSINHLLATLFLLLSLSRLASIKTLYTRVLAPLRVYGRSAFFFYVMHFYVYIGMRFLLTAMGFIKGDFGFFGSQEGNLPDAGFWCLWVVGLVLLYFMCERYGRFKMGTGADSLWRLF
ncbi:hypothetical protein HK097_006201, partial [Rhizophlyctis rosea]